MHVVGDVVSKSHAYFMIIRENNLCVIYLIFIIDFLIKN